jgi:hypothetical protein
MRFFGLGKRPVQQDPAQQDALLAEVRDGFGPHVQGRFADQAAAVRARLAGDDGMLAAARIITEFADAANAAIRAQAPDADRRNYRPLWRSAGAHLRWPLFALPYHPYVQVVAAVEVIGAESRRVVRAFSPEPLLARMFEILDLTLIGWEFARVAVDPDAAALAAGLITATRNLNDAIGDPPPLPPPVREWMRRNTTVAVYDPLTRQTVAGFNPGATMREALLA